ncbi:FAD-binding oxidoreductase [Rhodobacteraceae bacterium CCMM004]|nr:FAD-binding oxidoreductase [Rhodobacteraceae bacterium CCMM004]
MSHLDVNDRPGAHADSWYAATATPPGPFAPLDGDARTGVVVVGGGYTGLSAALHLAEAGVDVTLIEAHRVAWGASGRNGGQVHTGQRQPQTWLERHCGATAARHLWNLAEDAKALTERLARTHAPEARWTPGIVQADRSAAAARGTSAEADHMARVYGYDRVEVLDRGAAQSLLGTDRVAGGALDRGGAHLHPLAYGFGLARAAAAAGARLCEGTRVRRLIPGPRPAVETDRGRVSADTVILAAGGYLGGLDPWTAARVMPINNFIVATEPLGVRAPLAQDVAAADDRFVVNYWRQTPDGRLLFGGGESYGARFPSDIAAVVRRPLAALYPDLAEVRVDYAWGGTLAITRSRMPVVGTPAPGVLVAGGYSGHGVAMATLAGRLLAEEAQAPSDGFAALAGVAVPPFPGGPRLRPPLLALAMSWFALRDRLGL